MSKPTAAQPGDLSAAEETPIGSIEYVQKLETTLIRVIVFTRAEYLGAFAHYTAKRYESRGIVEIAPIDDRRAWRAYFAKSTVIADSSTIDPATGKPMPIEI